MGKKKGTPEDDMYTIALDDLCMRFLINIPEDEQDNNDRIMFQIEQAHWFYMDFYLKKHPSLPRANMKQFGFDIFEHCPPLQGRVSKFDAIYSKWSK